MSVSCSRVIEPLAKPGSRGTSDRIVDRATSPRGAAIVIACATVIITFLSGFLMAVLDHENDVTLGSGLWWAIQTVTTVGYGDNVPTTFAGRVLAALVMLFGIGFLTVITAAITSTFIARSQVEQHESEPPRADRFDRIGRAARPNRSRPRERPCRQENADRGTRAAAASLDPVLDP